VIALTLMLLGASAVVATVLTWSARAVGRRMALLDTPGSAGHFKPTVHRTPNIGGVAIFLTVAGFIGGGLLGARCWGAALTGRWPVLEEHLPGLASQTPMGLGLLACLLALHLTGLIDDRRALRPLWKLGVMTVAASVMVFGFDVRLLTALDAPAHGAWLSGVLTVVWFLAVTNAVNFMDNMDGLSAGVGGVASAFFLASALQHGQWFVAMTLAVLLGGLLGFLVFNFPWTRSRRATIFMGDGGSLVVGFLLAFLTVRGTYVDPAAPGAPGRWYGVFLPICVLSVPLYDLVSVVLIRLSQGKSPMVGDQQHFSHRLRSSGLSVRRTLAVNYGCAAITGIGGVTLGAVDGWRAVLVGLQTVLVLLLLGLYEHATRERSAGGAGA